MVERASKGHVFPLRRGMGLFCLCAGAVALTTLAGILVGIPARELSVPMTSGLLAALAMGVGYAIGWLERDRADD